jgi:hypothetical protein
MPERKEQNIFGLTKFAFRQCRFLSPLPIFTKQFSLATSNCRFFQFGIAEIIWMPKEYALIDRIMDKMSGLKERQARNHLTTLVDNGYHNRYVND